MTMNTNRMIELALVFFVSLLSFSIGTYVGKKYSDNQHRLAVLEPQNSDVAHSDVIDHGSTDSHVANNSEQNTEGKSSMTDADVAKLAEEFASEDETESSSGSDVVEFDAKPVTEITDSTVTAKAAYQKKPTLAAQPTKTVQPGEKNSAAEALKRDVASISEKAKTIGSSLYTVQVGAYPVVTDADKMVNSLKARGYQASSVSAVVNGKTWYRVQVGLFDNLQSAQSYKKELMEQNRLASAIIQKVK
jgi:cell division protein FtsN